MNTREKYYQDFMIAYNKGLNDFEIAKELNKSPKAIFAYRKSKNLPPIKPYRVLTKEQFLPLYNEGKGDCEIGRILGIDDNTIWGFRTRLKLPTNLPVFNKSIELTQIQKEALVGTLLGDANLRTKSGNYTGKIEHSIKQKDYCLWKYEIFKNLSLDVTYSDRVYFRDKTQKIQSIYFQFKHNQELGWFYHQFYDSGKKQVTKELLEYLTPFAIAIWFMDDGTYNHYCCSLCTDSFNKESVELLVDFFKEKYGIITHVNKRNRIYFDAITRSKFLELISSYVHESMKYKLEFKKNTKIKI